MKKQSLVYVAILIPIFMIIVTILGILWYQKDLHPTEDFLYLSSESYEAFDCLHQIKFLLLPNQPKPRVMQPCNRTQLYVYHFKTHASTAMTLATARHLKLSSTATDNYTISADVGGGNDLIWPFFTTRLAIDFNLTKGNYRRALHIQQYAPQQTIYSLQFIAWIMP